MHKILSVIPSKIVNMKKDLWKEAYDSLSNQQTEGIILKYYFFEKEITCMITKVGKVFNSGVYVNGEVLFLNVKLPLDEIFLNTRTNLALILRDIRNGNCSI